MTSFVLVHGACHQASHWGAVIDRLERRGHRGIAVDLPGHPDSDGNATLDDAIRATCDAIAPLTEPAILVGHSLGGMVIAGAAERMAERLSRVDFLTALLPRNGDSAATIGIGEGFHAATVSVVDKLGRVSTPRDDAQRIFFDGLETPAIDTLCATDMGYITASVRLTSERFGTLAKRYIVCLRDRAITADAQRLLAANWPGVEQIDLNAGHGALITAPDEVVKILLR